MDPLLFSTYLASAALGPAALGWLTARAYSWGREGGALSGSEALKYSAALGLLSTPVVRHYSEVSRDLEKCVMKEPKVKLYPDGKLKVVPYLEARRDALEAAVPVWFYYSFPTLVSAMATPNDKQRVLLTLVGITCAGAAAACRFQKAWRISGREYDSQELRPGKPMLYFNKTDSNASSHEDYSAEVN